MIFLLDNCPNLSDCFIAVFYETVCGPSLEMVSVRFDTLIDIFCTNVIVADKNEIKKFEFCSCLVAIMARAQDK